MKNTFWLLITMLLLSSNYVLGQESERKSIAVTVYNANLGVVKDTRSLDIKPGTSRISITDVAQFIDPASVHIKFNGTVLEQNFQYDLVSLDKILNKYLDREVRLIGEKDELLEGKLLSIASGQAVIQKKEGGLIMLPNISKYRFSVDNLPEGLITKPTLLWLVEPGKGGKQDIEISYQTAGLNWQAEYVAVLNESDTKIDLNSWVSINNNSGTMYSNAKLKLVAGDLNLISTRRTKFDETTLYAVEKAAKPSFEEKEFFEYHIYNLQRPATLAQNENKQISLFEAGNISVSKKYLYRSGSWRAYSPEYGNKVSVIVEFENSKTNNLGIPMPKGKVRLYKSDGTSLEFIGEDMIDHTPLKGKINLSIGSAFDISVKEIQTESRQITGKVSEQSFKISLRNSKKEDVTIDVERFLGSNWEVVSSSLPYEKKDANNILFHVPVKKDSEFDLAFTIRYEYK